MQEVKAAGPRSISESFMKELKEKIDLLYKKFDEDDFINWATDRGLLVDPDIKRKREAARKLINESTDADQLAEALEVLLTTKEAEGEREIVIGSVYHAEEKIEYVDAKIEYINTKVVIG